MDIVRALGGSMERAPWGWLLLVVAITALIRAWPVLAKQAIEARAQLRKEKREDLSDCHDRLDAMGVQIAKVREDFRQIELKLVGAITAYKILDLEVETHLPGSTALGQARAVMSTAFALSPSTPPDPTPNEGPARH
jgi:hypothetical protein